MVRHLMNELQLWKNATPRKPLILQGARQVGKTWIINEFGKKSFQKIAYLNFESSERLKTIFSADLDTERIISILEIETRQKIEAETTLVIFDEIQEAEKGLTALKYFYEQAPQYYIIAAGSLLGVSLHQNHSFPVGKVDILQLYPLSFMEFLENVGEELLVEQMKMKNWAVLNTFHDSLVEKLRLYYFIGGMPEAVANYINNKNFETVRSIQNNILLGYENDFSKHAPTAIVPKIRLVWNAILSQLAKKTKSLYMAKLKKAHEPMNLKWP